MKKRLLALATAFIALAVLLSACGGTPAQTASPAPSTAPGALPEVPPEAPPMTTSIPAPPTVEPTITLPAAEPVPVSPTLIPTPVPTLFRASRCRFTEVVPSDFDPVFDAKLQEHNKDIPWVFVFDI